MAAKVKISRKSLYRRVFRSLPPGFKLKNRILIATHHKTGTNWMRSIFKDIAKDLSLRLLAYHVHPPAISPPYDIVHSSQAYFSRDMLEDSYRGIHMVRDPRDQIVSAVFYHQKSNEPWLQIPRVEFGEKSYQETLNSFGSLEEQINFEMEHNSNVHLLHMEEIADKMKDFKIIKYEDLIVDRGLERFRKIFEYLGFAPIVMNICLAAAKKNSLFSGNVRSSHVRSGAAGQWKNYFSEENKMKFKEQFPYVLEKLDYEKDTSW